LGRRKGVFDILKAVPLVQKHCSDVKFYLAGQEDRLGEQSRIDRACAETKLNGAVQFLGLVSGQAKLDLFLRASVFVLPSYGENLPYALLEAMGAGLPVVATPVGAIPELVEDGRNGFLIPPGDYQALAARIVRLLEDASLRAAMSRANVERIRASYLPEVAATQFDAIYSRLLGIGAGWVEHR
jgi:glycosyltransferase involved in cell wall biosynthesis